jgi:predicted aminopeptidase
MSFIRTLGFISVVFVLSSCYYMNQGLRFAYVYGKASPAESVLDDPERSPDEKKLILLVESVMEFAVTSLGLRDNGNYSSYVFSEKNYLVDVVSACSRDSFDQYQFDYLALGRLPYKGFFNPEDARKEAAALEAKGYDVYTRKVSAFSTLGLLHDPIMSYMTSYDTEVVADIVIHEQLHATLFLPKYPDFSENLATFVGEQGALDYMKNRFGDTSDEYIKSVDSFSDQKTYGSLVIGLYDELSAVYKLDISKEEKLTLKAERIAAWKKRFSDDFRRLFKSGIYPNVERLEINNAYISTMLDYRKDSSTFEQLYEKTGGALKPMVAALLEIVDNDNDPDAAVKAFCAQ